MTTIYDPVEWLKAQVEMYLATISKEQLVRGSIVQAEMEMFVEYVEKKFEPKGLFDR